RLIGRSLRAISNRRVLGERTITLDCDVLQADGGTRTAAITGAYVAFAIACQRLMKERKISKSLITSEVAAVSVGIVDGTALLDLKYDEDSRAEVDMNVVCTGDGRFIEVQGTAVSDRRRSEGHVGQSSQAGCESPFSPFGAMTYLIHRPLSFCLFEREMYQ